MVARNLLGARPEESAAMSYILDALKKMEREKARTSDQSGMTMITGDLFSEGAPRPVTGNGWKLAGVAALAASLAVAVTWFLLAPARKKPIESVSAPMAEKAAPRPALVVSPPPAPPKPLTPPRVVSPHAVPGMAAHQGVKPASPRGAKVAAARPKPHKRREEHPAAVRRRQAPLKPAVATTAPPTDVKVSGIAWQDERKGRRAVINGFLLKEGSVVSGARVTEIQKDRVRFTQPGGAFDLMLATPRGGHSRHPAAPRREMTGERPTMSRFFSLLLIALTLTACGKRGPLIYPDMLIPAPPAAVTGRQSGRAVKLSFQLVSKDRTGHEIKDLNGALVFKRALASGQGPACNACSADFTLLRRLYLQPSTLERTVQRFGSTFVLLDSDVLPGEQYTYLIRPFTKENVEGQTSPPVTVTVVDPVPAPVLRATPDPVEIHFHFSESHAGKGTLVGYNLYRAPQGETIPYLPLNGEPITGASYTDTAFDRTLSYKYIVRSVVKAPNGELAESEPSNEVLAHVSEEQF